MRHRAVNEINKDAAELGLITLTQFKMFQRHHQRHQILFIVFKPPAGRKNR
ncbi:hypothetical protein D3C87_1889340 [compost metagenome]